MCSILVFDQCWPLQSLGVNQRNYAEIQITIEPEFSVVAQLKVIGLSKFYILAAFKKHILGQAVSTNLYEITSQMSVDVNEDEDRLFEEKII